MSNQKQTQVWQQAVAATEAMLLARGYSTRKAHTCALKRSKSLHPQAQAALKRNLALSRAAIQNPQSEITQAVQP